MNLAGPKRNQDCSPPHKGKWLLRFLFSRVLPLITHPPFFSLLFFLHPLPPLSPSRDTRVCFNYISYWGGKNHLLFVGDLRLRQLFAEVVNVFSSDEGVRMRRLSASMAPGNLSFRDPNFNLLIVSFFLTTSCKFRRVSKHCWLTMRFEKEKVRVIGCYLNKV